MIEATVDLAITIDGNLEKTLVEFPKLSEAEQDRIRAEEFEKLKQKALDLKDFLFYLATPQFQWVDGPKVLEDFLGESIEIVENGENDIEGAYIEGKFTLKIMTFIHGIQKTLASLGSRSKLSQLKQELPANRFQDSKLIKGDGDIPYKIVDKPSNRVLAEQEIEIKGYLKEASTRDIPKTRNGHLANKTHPVTGIPFDANGYPDFSSKLYRTGRNDVNIGGGTGNRLRDEALANAAAGYSSTPRGYTWHHHQDVGRMQLVEQTPHRKTGHTGGFSIWSGR